MVRGEPGAGKTALLDYLGEQASGCRVAHAAGVESEMELVYAGLHQLVTPMLDRLERLPAPQANALQTAFGLAPGRRRTGSWSSWPPSACWPRWPRSTHWSAWSTTRSGWIRPRRRSLASLPVGWPRSRSSWCSRPGFWATNWRLPELVVESLQEADARALLNSVLTGPLDPLVHDRILAEAAGNPLALVELPRGVTPAELAGGFALPDAIPLPGRTIEFPAAA